MPVDLLICVCTKRTWTNCNKSNSKNDCCWRWKPNDKINEECCRWWWVWECERTDASQGLNDNKEKATGADVGLRELTGRGNERNAHQPVAQYTNVWSTQPGALLSFCFEQGYNLNLFENCSPFSLIHDPAHRQDCLYVLRHPFTLTDDPQAGLLYKKEDRLRELVGRLAWEYRSGDARYYCWVRVQKLATLLSVLHDSIAIHDASICLCGDDWRQSPTSAVGDVDRLFPVHTTYYTTI